MADEHHKQELPQVSDEQWSDASACGSGQDHAPRGEEEFEGMRSMWRNVLEREGKLSPSATKPADAGRRPDPGAGG